MDSIKKSEKKQEFKSSDVISTLILTGITIAVVVSLFARQFVDKRFSDALLDTDSLSAQILHSGIKVAAINVKSRGQRSVASLDKKVELKSFLSPEGKLGTDPWGESYNYKVIGAEKEGATHILVWSSGPDRQKESVKHLAEDPQLLDFYTEKRGGIALKGDDIGFIRSIK